MPGISIARCRFFRTSGLVGAIAIAILLSACAPTPSSTSPRPSPEASLSPEVAAALEFRELYGLRRDLPFVEALAQSALGLPGLEEWGVPLLAEEVAELKARGGNARKVMPIIETYGRRHPEDWAGTFLASSGGGSVIAQFSDNIDEHTAAVRRLVGPSANVAFRDVRWSIEALEVMLEDVRADTAWFESIDAWVAFAEVQPIDNRIELNLSSAHPGAVDLTLAHFGADGWLHVTSDGIGVWTGPTGALVVELVDANGNPVGGTDVFWKCRLVPREAAAYSGGSLALVNGRCESDSSLGATTYDVTITRPDGAAEVVVATGTVVVPANETGYLRLVAPSG